MHTNKKINIISNRNFKSRKTTKILIDNLKKHGFIASENYSNEAVLNIVVGGDGAFLRAIHRYKFPTIPFIGVNTGHLGFYQEILPENIDEFIRKYILNEYITEEMYLLETVVKTKFGTKDIKSINELVIKATNSKVMHLDLYIEGKHLERFSGDGLIISTPYGSTAYNYSAGGSIIYPTLKSLQITPIAPLISKAFRSLPNSVVVPSDLTITIKPESRHSNSTLIVNDGLELKYNQIESIDIKFSNMKINKLNFNDNMYWDNLKSKFL